MKINYLLPLLITIITILGNYFIPLFNNTSIGNQSNINKLEASPAGWTFSIWTIIYISLLYLSYGLISGSLKWDNTSLLLFLLSSIGNLSWIYLWTSKNKFLAQFSLLLIVISLGLLWIRNRGNNNIYQNIIALYLGWTLGALILNLFIVNYNNINGSKIVIILLCLIQILWLLLLDKKNKKESLAIMLVGIWTSLGILTNKSTKLKLYKYLLFIVMLISSIVSYIKYFN